jgi:hypothetical protein
MIYYSNLHVDFAPLDCGWLCVSLSVQNAKRGAQFMSAYCGYVVYHNAVIVYLAAATGQRLRDGFAAATPRHDAAMPTTTLVPERMMPLSTSSFLSSTMVTTGTMPTTVLTPERMTPSSSLSLSSSKMTMTGAAAKKKKEEAAARRRAVDNRQERMRGRGVDTTTSRQTRKRTRRWRQEGQQLTIDGG